MFNLANQLTLARIFFVVPIILLLYFPGKITCFLAAVLFGIASLTDFLDGHIARKGNHTTCTSVPIPAFAPRYRN